MSIDTIDTAGIAESLMTTRDTVLRYVKRPSFPVPVIKFGKTRRWLRSDVETWVRETTAASQKPSPVPTALYRHFDVEGLLLYVGVSLSPLSRLMEHRASHWSKAIRQITVEWFDDREQALAAELAAIQAERPLHNVSGTKQ